MSFVDDAVKQRVNCVYIYELDGRHGSSWLVRIKVTAR